MNKKEETIATYNATAGEMAEKFRGLGARVADVERGFALCNKKNPIVLEIGCGDGRDAREIQKRTDHYRGIDISDAMIAIAREYAPDGIFEVADVETYTFPKELDIVFSFASLLHSKKEDVERVLQRVHKALTDDGVFYISLKHGEYGEYSKTDEFGTRTYYFYTPELLRELAGDLYEVVYEHVEERNGQMWLAMVLRKS